MPMMPKKTSFKWISADNFTKRIFLNFCIIKHFIDIISPENDLKEHLEALFEDFTSIDTKAMGFPDNWKSEPLWKNE